MPFSLSTSYAGEALLGGFDFSSSPDLSHGFVSYQSKSNAQDMGLYSIDPDTQAVRLGVDHTHKYAMDQGRPSVRLESKESFNHGLFIADFSHMPPSQCGVWPAFWAYGTDWPNGGELDIIEGANDAHNNIISAHTADGCVLDKTPSKLFSGEKRNEDCSVGANNIGCGFNPPVTDTTSYGDGFNAVHGGVYAMLWDSGHISVWHFPRTSIPEDISAKQPEPDAWGPPTAVFGGKGCSTDKYFKNMKLVINTNFCGDYGNAIWNQGTCGQYAATCPEYVANNPEAFTNAYWDVNYIDAYHHVGKASNYTYSSKPITPSTTMSTVTSSSTVTVTVQPTPAGDAGANLGPHNPVTVDDHAYLGCFSSTSQFKSFTQVDQSNDMDLERCVSACQKVPNARYAGIYDTRCFCAANIDPDTRALPDTSMCDHHCPGNSTQFCGGLLPMSSMSNSSSGSNGNGNTTLARAPVGKRAMFSSAQPVLLSVYGATSDEEPPSPPPMATGVPPNATTLITPVVTYKTLDIHNKVIQTQHTVTLTVTHCGCATPAPVSVPMTTRVHTCDACGDRGENTVTLTVPNLMPTLPTMAMNATTATTAAAANTNPAPTSSMSAPPTAGASRTWSGASLSILLSLCLVAIAL